MNKNGKAPIYLSFYLNRQKVEISTHISVSEKNFDPATGLIGKREEFFSDKNLMISELKSRINDIFVRYRLLKRKLTIDDFWFEYNTNNSNGNFYEFCEKYQSLRFQELSHATRKKHLSCINMLKLYREHLSFSDLTTETVRRFILFLRNTRGNNEVTINKTIRIIGVYFNEAVKQGLMQSNPIHDVKMRGCNDTSADSISESQLQHLYNMYRNNFYEGRQPISDVLEFFLFMCFSSLHLSDAKSIQLDQISDHELIYVRTKMKNIKPKLIHIPICEPLRRIINNRRKDRKEGLLWGNIISDQKINKYLKAIAEDANIEKDLSAKFGRHTFATLFLSKTKDINALKDIMGHTNIKQTLVYAHVLDADRVAGVQTFNVFDQR
ncbi:MAG: phage integrase SAM-like domain-containing protein [Parabacteroides sp.]